jgi:phage I-like protein
VHTIVKAFAFSAVSGSAEKLPTEFRIFSRGLNNAQHDPAIFDDVAAESVMRNASVWGVDFMIDLEHQSLDHHNADPNARDARGWFRLELRNGELWAVDVRWTEDGAQRILQKRQRYISPAFKRDADGRVVSIVNAAIVAMPATNEAHALIAASLNGAKNMNGEQIQAALDALISGDSEKSAEILKSIIADAALSGSPAPAVETEVLAVAPVVPANEEGDEEKTVAASVHRLTGKSGSASVAEIEAWRASHIELETKSAAIAAERTILDAAERRRLCVEIVKLGIMTPGVVWADDAATTPRGMLATAELAQLRALVGSGAKRVDSPAIAPRRVENESGERQFSTVHGVVALSAREIKICAESKLDPKVYATNKAIHLAAKGVPNG